MKSSIAQRQPEQTPISIHVLPDSLEPERVLALVARYCDLIEVGQHLPFPYIAAVFSKAHALVQAHRAEQECAS